MFLSDDPRELNEERFPAVGARLRAKVQGMTPNGPTKAHDPRLTISIDERQVRRLLRCGALTPVVLAFLVIFGAHAADSSVTRVAPANYAYDRSQAPSVAIWDAPIDYQDVLHQPALPPAGVPAKTDSRFAAEDATGFVGRKGVTKVSKGLSGICVCESA